jgi:uncharacterized protein
MEFIIIALVASGAAMLTFFSGFGLGTILLPAFALFFPVEIAIAMTAVVHLFNNIFKISLIWKAVNLKVTALFAIPAALFAIGGALLLNHLSSDDALFTYQLGNKEFEVTLIKLIIGVLLIIFAIIEIDKRFDKLAFQENTFPWRGFVRFLRWFVGPPGRVALAVSFAGRFRKRRFYCYRYCCCHCD